jgi:hypothetical protein
VSGEAKLTLGKAFELRSALRPIATHLVVALTVGSAVWFLRAPPEYPRQISVTGEITAVSARRDGFALRSESGAQYQFGYESVEEAQRNLVVGALVRVTFVQVANGPEVVVSVVRT